MADLSDTLAERGSRYGEFIEHAKIAQALQMIMHGSAAHHGEIIKTRWDNLDADMRQALTTIADKIARILNGDPAYIDNWHDIQGYARLVEKRLEASA